jgi:hypothetical protein
VGFREAEDAPMASDTKVRLVTTATAGEVGQGFNARLAGVTLADLIQMKCLSGARECVRVSSGDKVGALQFSSGQLTHAVAPDLVGEGAVLALLRWKTGDCEACSSLLPPRSMVRRSWQSLLLDAAKAMDEEAAASKRASIGSTSPPVVDLDDSSPPPAPSRIVSVRMTADGQVIESAGAADDLAASSAYAMHMANHIGLELGLDAFAGCELRGGELRTVLVVEENGDVSAYQSNRDSDVAQARARAGL